MELYGDAQDVPGAVAGGGGDWKEGWWFLLLIYINAYMNQEHQLNPLGSDNDLQMTMGRICAR